MDDIDFGREEWRLRKQSTGQLTMLCEPFTSHVIHTHNSVSGRASALCPRSAGACRAIRETAGSS